MNKNIKSVEYWFDDEEKTLVLDMNYPRSEENIDTIEVNICCVRASDGIRITYDFERDGYVIMQPKEYQWLDEEKNGIKYMGSKEVWMETAFVQSWAFDEEEITKEEGEKL